MVAGVGWTALAGIRWRLSPKAVFWEGAVSAGFGSRWVKEAQPLAPCKVPDGPTHVAAGFEQRECAIPHRGKMQLQSEGRGGMCGV